MSDTLNLAPPPIRSWPGMPAPWAIWFQLLYKRVGEANSVSPEDVILMSDDGEKMPVQDIVDLLTQCEPGIAGNDEDLLQFLSVAERKGIRVEDILHLLDTQRNTDRINRVWNDWNLGIDFTPTAGAGVPQYNTLVGNIKKYQFAVNDAFQWEGTEFLHEWAEGTPIFLHVHWVTGGLNDATARGVKWEAEYTFANPLEATATYSTFASSTTVSAEVAIPANQPDRTHRVSSIATIAVPGIRIGAQFTVRLKRIAAAGTAPVADPFVISLGVHYQRDTHGSRGIASK